MGPMGDGVGHLVQRRTQDPKDQGSNPVRSTGKMCEFVQVKIVVLTRCRRAQTPCTDIYIYIRTRKNHHVRTIQILWPLSEFGELRKQEKTQHALVGLGIDR